MFSFLLFSNYFLTFLLTFSLINWLFRSSFTIFYIFVIFPKFLLLTYNLVSLLAGEHISLISNHLNYFQDNIRVQHISILQKVSCGLRRMCILLLFGRTLNKHLLVLFKFSISLLIFSLGFHPLLRNSPTIIVDVSIYSFNSVSFCFMYFGILLLGT